MNTEKKEIHETLDEHESSQSKKTKTELAAGKKLNYSWPVKTLRLIELYESPEGKFNMIEQQVRWGL